MQGKGKFYYNNGYVYVGDFKNNVLEGNGVMYYNDGDRY